MDDPNHLRTFVPSDIEFQCYLLHVYHDSPVGMHRSRDTTYKSLSHDFYRRHVHKHVRNWACRCPQCISFKSPQPSHGPIPVPFSQRLCRRTPPPPSGNRWILTAVYPYSNYLRAIPVPGKTATTAANALFHYVFLQLGFPTLPLNEAIGFSVLAFAFSVSNNKRNGSNFYNQLFILVMFPQF